MQLVQKRLRRSTWIQKLEQGHPLLVQLIDQVFPWILLCVAFQVCFVWIPLWHSYFSKAHDDFLLPGQYPIQAVATLFLLAEVYVVHKLFSFLHDARSLDFYKALPYSNKGLFVELNKAGFITLLLPRLADLVVGLSIFPVYGRLLIWEGRIFLTSLFFFLFLELFYALVHQSSSSLAIFFILTLSVPMALSTLSMFTFFYVPGLAVGIDAVPGTWNLYNIFLMLVAPIPGASAYLSGPFSWFSLGWVYLLGSCLLFAINRLAFRNLDPAVIGKSLLTSHLYQGVKILFSLIISNILGLIFTIMHQESATFTGAADQDLPINASPSLDLYLPHLAALFLGILLVHLGLDVIVSKNRPQAKALILSVGASWLAGLLFFGLCLSSFGGLSTKSAQALSPKPDAIRIYPRYSAFDAAFMPWANLIMTDTGYYENDLVLLDPEAMEAYQKAFDAPLSVLSSPATPLSYQALIERQKEDRKKVEPIVLTKKDLASLPHHHIQVLKDKEFTLKPSSLENWDIRSGSNLLRFQYQGKDLLARYRFVDEYLNKEEFLKLLRDDSYQLKLLVAEAYRRNWLSGELLVDPGRQVSYLAWETEDGKLVPLHELADHDLEKVATSLREEAVQAWKAMPNKEQRAISSEAFGRGNRKAINEEYLRTWLTPGHLRDFSASMYASSLYRVLELQFRTDPYPDDKYFEDHEDRAEEDAASKRRLRDLPEGQEWVRFFADKDEWERQQEGNKFEVNPGKPRDYRNVGPIPLVSIVSKLEGLDYNSRQGIWMDYNSSALASREALSQSRLKLVMAQMSGQDVFPSCPGSFQDVKKINMSPSSWADFLQILPKGKDLDNHCDYRLVYGLKGDAISSIIAFTTTMEQNQAFFDAGK